jgi:hypothetical protein
MIAFLETFSKKNERLVPAVALVCIVLSASWMGNLNGGYFVGEWALVALILATLMLVTSVAGVLHSARSQWSSVAIVFFALYTAWTFLSLLWAPNRGDAWVGAGQTLLYLLTFWVGVCLVALGASRRWALIASTLGPATIAAFTLLALPSRVQDLFDDNRLLGSVGYYNGEAAFLLVPFWVGIYLAGSRLINPVLRGLVLAGAVLSLEVAVLTQSRGAMVASAVSLPVFFVFSGQRLRGLLALVPVVAALLIAFPDLNNVYLEFLNGGSPDEALSRVVPTVWATTTGAGLYGLAWGHVDQRWSPPISIVRAVGAVALAGGIAVLLVGAWTATERVGNPIAWGEQKWEAFRTNDRSGQEQSRYLSAGTGRYTLWQVAWKDFASHPALGVGTHNYEATYYRLRESTAGRFVSQPHMLPLEVLAERGAVGGVLFLGFLATCLAGGLWKRFKALSAEGKGQVGAMVAAVTYWLIHSSVDWFWQIPAVSLPAMLYLAMLVAPWSNREFAPSRWPLRLVGAGIAVLAVAAVAPLYIADRYLTQSYATANPWVALTAVERAQKFNPVDPHLPQREADLALQIGDWPRAEDAYRRSIRLNPEHYAPYELLAFFHEEGGEPEKALSLYREALLLNPLDKELNQRVARLRAETTDPT